MKIQGAVRACRKRDDLFARPRAWQGSGEAVDFGKHYGSERTRKVRAIPSGAFLIDEWNVLPADLLCSWEVIPSTTLVEEVKKRDAREN